MRTAIALLALLLLSQVGFSSTQGALIPSSLPDLRVEFAELEAKIEGAKAAGLPVDPAWTARILELRPLFKGHPGNVTYDLPVAQTEGGFAPGAVIRPQQLTPLEAQIKELEFQIDGGAGGEEPDPVHIAELKEQLSELYAQRSENRERNPLDQGADACPATVLTGTYIYDTGTTTGRVNNYNPLIPCGTSTAADVIYQWTPPVSSIYTISTDGSSYDTYLHIRWLGVCPGTTQYACDDDGGPGTTSQITMRFYSFETYYIIVDGYNTNNGAYVLWSTESCKLPVSACDITECGEFIYDPNHSINDCNGACNNQNLIPTWQDIQLCQSVCGKSFTYVNHQGNNWRDTDSYQFTLTEACSLEITLNTEMSTQLFIFNSGCPWSGTFFDEVWDYPCSTVTYITNCLPAGTYSFWIGPTVFSGLDSLNDYRFRLDPIPCSGCRIDGDINAPGSAAWNTCGAQNDNSLRPSADYTYCVNIPYESDWTFSICNDDSIWDSFIYLTTQCNGGIIAQDDDGCGGVGLSVINCVHLAAGTYYLTVEGFASTYCGPFTLNVAECLGSCCFGDPANPTCEEVSQNLCTEFNGTFTFAEPCSSGACFTRPSCGAGAVVSQPPHLPDEPGNGYTSDLNLGVRCWEHFDADYVIGSLRFWGFSLTPACEESAQTFEVVFADSFSGDVCTYTLTLAPTVYPPHYFGGYRLVEYAAELHPPCTVSTGWFSVAEAVSACAFYWGTSPFGDGASVQISNGSAVPLNNDLAMCLGPECDSVDSLTIQLSSADHYQMSFWVPTMSLVRVWTSINPSAVFPATYWEVANGWVSGHIDYIQYATEPEQVFVINRDCLPAVAAPPAPTGLRRIE